MTGQDLEAENIQLLSSLWARLGEDRVDPVRLGLTDETARVLGRLDEMQVIRAAQVHVPLFDFACTPETLRQSFDSKPTNGQRNDDAQLFLSNRWRACEGPFVSAQMLFSMNRRMHATMREATYAKIVAAANSGISLLKLAVRHQYLFHAGAKFDLKHGQRTSLAICNSTRAGH